MAVTNYRIIYKSGVISRRSDEIRLRKVESSEIQQNIIGRILGYGDINITGTGGSGFVFKGIDSPMKIKRIVDSASNVFEQS